MTVAPPFPTESNVLAALRSFLLAVLPANVEVIPALQNRIPEAKGTEFVIMTPTRDRRLATNIDDYLDVRFEASIAGLSMTVSDLSFGSILPGAIVFGAGVIPNTTVVSQSSGTTGGPGVYVVAPPQTVALEVMASGAKTMMQEVEHAVQIDFHSADASKGLDMARTVSTMMRDEFGTDQFASQAPNYGVSPLYADDARQAPFTNEAQQVEWRWIVEAMLQADIVLSVPQQFADSVAVQTISVATYPP